MRTTNLALPGLQVHGHFFLLNCTEVELPNHRARVAGGPLNTDADADAQAIAGGL